MNRHLFYTVGLVVLLLALSANTWLGLNNRSKVETVVSHLSQTTKESAVQRVKTVEQRCRLTHLLIGVLERDDPKRLPAFRTSYMECETQLVKVRKIAAHA